MADERGDGKGDGTVSGDTLCQLFGISRQQLNLHANEGRIVRASRGRYHLARSVKNYVSHLREVAAGRGGQAASERLTSERARLAAMQADLAALRHARETGELVPAADVERDWFDAFRQLKSRLLAIPSRVRARDGQLTAAQARVIDEEIRQALEELANDEVEEEEAA